jgi:Tol biopolymer transport system component
VRDDTELREILRATAERATLPNVMPEPMRRKVTLRRTRTMGVACLMVVAIVVGGLQGIRALTLDDAAPQQPAGDSDQVAPEARHRIAETVFDVKPSAAAPEVPYVIDLNTGSMTPLPAAITRSLAEGDWDRFSLSPDGSSLAFVGEDDDGSPQIFIAGIDGTNIRQVTHDPRRATSPAWSPDGSRLAYEAYGSGDFLNLFVLDLATGKSQQITDEATPCDRDCLLRPQFTPDGLSLIYTGGTYSRPAARIVALSGGSSTNLIELSKGGLRDTGGASMSPDGSLVTFVGGGSPFPDRPRAHCGPCRIVANADGTSRRIYAIPALRTNTSGAWSPDGTRIVSTYDGYPHGIVVVDLRTEDASVVAMGRVAIWLDDHTLLVDV